MKMQFADENAGRASACPGCRRPLTVPQLAQAVASSDTLAGPPSSLHHAGINATMSLPDDARTDQAGARPVAELLARQNGDGRRYLLAGEVARGGMGAILRGIDRDLRREVALKVMLDPANTRQKARFIEEAQITGQLEHPNIVPVHELGVDEHRRPYFAMKMVRGRSLAQVLDTLRDKPAQARDYTLGRLVNVLVSVCHALAYAHARGVVHRDLKPANVMVGDFGEVYVMDWGLAKVLAGGPEPPAAAADKIVPDSANKSRAVVVTSRDQPGDKTQDGAILGTPAYMAPEQALGGTVDQRSDVYALGALLYAVLTLRPPVETERDYVGVLMAVAEGNILPPEKRTPERAGQIPSELSAIAMKALAKEPGRRYQTAEEFRRDLELYLEGRAVSAKADTSWEMAVKFVKRNKGFSAAALVGSVMLLLVLAGSSVINYWERVRAEEARVKADEAREQANAAKVEAQTAHANYLKEQDEKRRQAKSSAPAFLRAARHTADQKQFGDALAQANIALDYDPSLTDGHLLKGQLLLTLQRYAEAATPLEEYLKRKPDDAAARKLLRLAQQPREDGPYLKEIVNVFEAQEFFAGMGHVNDVFLKRVVGPLQERLPGYRKQIDAGWPGLKPVYYQKPS
jgi:serine/threonine protein kinase